MFVSFKKESSSREHRKHPGSIDGPILPGMEVCETQVTTG